MIRTVSPIFIASKGRAGDSKTISALLLEGLDLEVFVEPQDADAYRNAWPTLKLQVLPANDRGVSFVRQTILQYARARKLKWFWMLDDDISQTYEVVEKRCRKISWFEALSRAEIQIGDHEGAAMGSLEYQQFAWSAAKPFKFNSYCEVAVLINVEKTRHVNYRENCKEDRDLVLQVLSGGWDVVRTSWLAFSAPKNGSNKGGLQDAYKTGLEAQWCARMVQLWPGVCEHVVKPDGRRDVKINWKLFKRPES